MELITTLQNGQVKTCGERPYQLKGGMPTDIHSTWLGLNEYNTTWDLQKNYAAKIFNSKQTCILGCEHPNVITLGTRIKHVEPTSVSTEIPVVVSNRGGLTTLHTPGQLIVYPILSLRWWEFGVKEWVDFLLQVTQISLFKCNIIIISQNNGLFTKNGKIASIGINIHKGISLHGLAINISNDLALFSKISPCGVQNQAMDKANNYIEISPESFFLIWCETFREGLKKKAKQDDNHLQSP